MKVKDLIKKLNRYNPDTHVYVVDNNWNDVVAEAQIVRARVDTMSERRVPKGEIADDPDATEYVALITFEDAER